MDRIVYGHLHPHQLDSDGAAGEQHEPYELNNPETARLQVARDALFEATRRPLVEALPEMEYVA